MARAVARSLKLYVRLTPAEKAKLDGEAAARGMKTAQLVREQLGRLIAVERAAPAAGGNGESHAASADRSPESPSGPPRDLAVWLAGRTGMPKALMKRAISAGRVTVDGTCWWTQLIDGDLDRRTIALDGQRV